ncbi:RNA-binding protein-like protein [Leishmania mexicana MHOM/GT/2001/U1103]|uniref:RNA-binding protein-like protein n=1 Tax=Leishmania mexicana (strain MHOM/GT/2001/U1103) TaxID=929439 RepID=E9AKV6_LEIMU|nr:RNA-binding protein-like protein [Leishmania mexicana MHOM/GT/2001/U1103]CBZ23559.1 RNA-binding protein-like protein [Leishmania mexicana MHOM/GT/2001/U1103]
MPNTCSKEQLLHISHTMRATDDSDMAAPDDGGDGADRHALRSPVDSVGSAGPQPLPLRRQFGLEGCTDVVSSGEGDAAAAPEAGGGAPLRGEVDVCSSSLSAAARHQNFLYDGLLGGDSEVTPRLGPTIHSAPSPPQGLMASASAVAATATHQCASSVPSRSFSSQGKPFSAILVPASRSDDPAVAARCYADPFAAAVGGSGSTSRSSSVGIVLAGTSTGMEGLYSDHYVNPLLRSRSGRSGGGSSGFFGGADSDEDDDDGSAALQAAVDAAVRFDDLASEDDVVGDGGKKRVLLRAGPTALSHLLVVASDTDDGAFTCAHSTKVDSSSPFQIPSGLGDDENERHRPHSAQTPGVQQCGRRGDRSTGGRPQMPNRAAAGVAAAPSSVPYFAAAGSAIVSPLQSMQPLTSPAAAAANPETATVTSAHPNYAAAQAQQQQLQQPRHHHHQCSSSLHPSPHGRRASSVAVPHTLPAGAAAIPTLGDVDSFWYVSPPQVSMAATHHHSGSGASMGGSTAAQNSTDLSFAVQPGTAGTGTGTGIGAQTPSNSLLSSPSVQPFYLYQVSHAAVAMEPQQAQPQPQGSASVLLYSPPQAYIGSGQAVAAHLHPALPTTAAATAVLGDSSRARSTSTPSDLYQRPVTQQPPPPPQVIGGYTLTPSANAAAAAGAAAAAAAAATPSEESSRALRNLYFRNLPHSWNTSMLRELCSRYGVVLSAKVAHHSTTNESLGYGFVLFEQRQSAVTCMAMLNQAHVHAEGEESRTLFVRMAHATAAPGFQEEGASDSTASSLHQPTELTPPSGAVGARLPQWILQHQQQQTTTSGLRSPRTPLSDSASMMLLSPGSAPQFYNRELSGVSVADAHRGQAHRHSAGDSVRTNTNASSNTSCAGGDSLRCTSPVGGAGNNSYVAVSRTSIPPSLSETCNFMGPKGAARSSAPPLRGLYCVSSANTTSSLLSPHQPHQVQQQQQQEGSLSYSSASASRSATAGATVTATAMAAAAAQRAGCNFCSPLSLSPNDTASLLALSPSVPHPTVQLPQSFYAPCASVSGKASSAKAAPAGSASATTSTRNVYITNLPLTWNTTKLRELCSQYGEIVSASVAHHPETNGSRGYGFVLFADERDAASCVMKLHQYHVPNSSHVLSCRFAKDKATPSIAYTLLSPSQESGLDSIGSGSGSPLPTATVRGSPTAATSKTVVPMIAMGGDADALESNLARNDTRGSVDGAVQDAVCMPIDVFCTLQQRVHAQCVQYLTQKHQLQRKGAEDNSEPTSAVFTAEVQSEELEKMMRYCVVYGVHVPTEGYGCVRPTDCRKASFRRAVDDAEQLLSRPPAEPSTSASSGLRSAGSALSTERGDSSGEVLDVADTAAPVTLSGTVVCTHAIAVGRAQATSPTLAGTTTMPVAPRTRRSMSGEPPCAPPLGVGMSDAESASQVATPEVTASPAAPLELWYTCTLFTTQVAAEAFVQAAAVATSGAGATINAEHGNLGNSSRSVAGASTVQLSSNGKDSLADTTLPSPSPAFDKMTNVQQTRFGLRDQVMVLSSAPLAVPAALPFTSSANTTTANSTRLLPTEEPYSQQRSTATSPQQQHQRHHLRPSHQLPPSTLLRAHTRDGSAAASTTQPRGYSLCPGAGIAAVPAHPSASTAEPLLCSPSSAETLLCSPPSHATHYTYPRMALTSPTDGASLTSPTPMMMVMGGNGDSSSTSSTAAPLAFPRDRVAGGGAGAAGRYPSATAARCTYLLGSPASTSSVNLSTGTHILSDSTTPPLGVALNFPSASSTHSTPFNAAGVGTPSGHPASAVHAAPAVFAAAPSHMTAARAWRVATSGAAATMPNVLSAPLPVTSAPSSSLSTEQAPPPPSHISYSLGSVIYAVPEAASATGGPPVLFNAAPISDVASPATLASSAQVSCTTPNATPQRSAQPLHP